MTVRSLAALTTTCRVRVALALVTAVLVSGCAADDTSERSSEPTTPRALTLLTSAPSPYALGDDVWEVWTCHVPVTLGHPVYADDIWRMPRTADDLAAIFDDGITDWFAERSHGLYRPMFTAGGRVAISAEGDGFDCADRAIARAGAGTNGVLVIADARHRDDVSGGWGRPGSCGSPCRRGFVNDTGRAVYVGAADFDPAWGERPPLDLVQHEIGHALDLPHSGDEGVGERYTSPIDMMSNSSAPREVRPDRRDAPDTIAANRLALGWLDLDDIAIVTVGDGTKIDLSASTGRSGTRAAVVALDDQRLIVVEVLVNENANDHLPGPGIAVHLIDQSVQACDSPSASPCTGQYRRHRPLAEESLHPGIPLLGQGDRLEFESVEVRVLRVDGSGGRVAIGPA
jgi:hypothetical protein